MDKLFWLVPGQIAGRSGPNKDPWKIAELAETGIDLVVSLNDAVGVDSKELCQYQIEHLHIELPPNIPPKAGDEQHCLAGLTQAWHQLEPVLSSGQTVLIHCRSGKDRTGLLMAYLVMQLEKLPPSEAIAMVKEVRPIALSAEGWLDMAEQVLSQLEPQLGQFSA
ncbi:dual specificity protein phosphatase family protein [Ferrimonas lipolytica]|uniref:Protein phosphatase n=1 Tax=Ferrimonas lipolytica TaxID=2724191 RepID=A0A6H1U8V1_9GAMM|nr:dual specificity protein phosphatase family protein [Ferrimonas lipolytica]QIZ75454.1 protein phosphatase [Ferrimonas lipolytica]